MTEVVFLARGLQHYREGFHTRVRSILAARGVRYRLLFSAPSEVERSKGDLWTPDWAEEVPIRRFGQGEQALVFQSAGMQCRNADLVVLGQHNRHLHNYGFILANRLGRGPRVAFFGHGRGFQTADPDGWNERVKRFWARQVDWWFPYTASGGEAVMAAGFPAERITVVNNAIDVSAIGASLAAIGEAEREALRAKLVGGSPNVGVYVGGVYPLKRIDFLIESSRRVRALVPDFHLVLIGGGEDSGLAEAAAGKHDWVHYLGPKFGREKSLLVSLGKVMLMPGLVGLAVLDSFAYGTPMVTTALPYHSPEFDYLQDGENGIVVQEAESSSAYALAVAELLTHDAALQRLRHGCAAALPRYSIQAMAERFAAGIMQALEQKQRG